MRQTDVIIYDKKRALLAAANKERSFRAKCEKMVFINKKLRLLQAKKVEIHKEVAMKLNEDQQSMIVAQNEFDEQLRASKYQNRLDREEFDVSNQRKVAVQKEEENESFSNNDAQKFSRQTGHHMANSTELPGHDHASTIMLKTKNRMSNILPYPHENEEEARRRYDSPETHDEEKVSMTRTMFKSIMTKAQEDQKVLADETSTKIAKVSFTEGIKEGSNDRHTLTIVHIWIWRVLIIVRARTTPAHMAANILPYSTQLGQAQLFHQRQALIPERGTRNNQISSSLKVL